MSAGIAQRSHVSVSRSELSSNWRAKGQATSDEVTSNPGFNNSRWTWPVVLGRHDSRNAGAPQHNSPPTSIGADEAAERAISEGRRLYVGNLSYFAKEGDVAGLFAGEEFEVKHISMSIDPFTGRNPSYCFVDLQDKQQADEAIQTLSGLELLGRPAKIKPGVAKSGSRRPNDGNEPWDRQRTQNRSAYNRWERSDAPDHWKGYSEQGRRVFVGGLPRMSNHYDVEKGVREFFQGYSVECISKVIVPRTQDRAKPEKRGWNDRYLFVDFATAEEADRAVKSMNGVQSWGVKVRVAKNRIGDSWKVEERQDWDDEQQLRQVLDESKETNLSHLVID